VSKCAGACPAATAECKVAGTCAPLTGACAAETNKAAGALCATYAIGGAGNCNGAGVCAAPCTGVVCPAATAQCKVAGTCSTATRACAAETDKAAGAACTITAAGDGACDGAGACAALAAPAGAWAAASEGLAFGCGLDAAGRAWCWGTNTWGDGNLGQGTTNPQVLNFPSLVVGGLLFASISCGPYHVCALATGGVAYCWGARRRA
jgi:hypothetical protein